jgi:hypothetical protein
MSLGADKNEVLEFFVLFLPNVSQPRALPDG